ncbi:hypothetical protein M413DRAFT_32489 [Hebeloma cylindrosporum]|uniref:Hydrophobin n=1 Tax=Hebeloma cylindrosporum TaxID=76867 RepID=A0A0C2XBZ5_HEBCY|nr:hypothetical protein M413DRAFT_32489 [Hebeloma cylindrosporum h7]
MKLSVASIVAFIGLFSQALAADVHHCAGPNSLRCPDGLTCCGPAVDGVGGTHNKAQPNIKLRPGDRRLQSSDYRSTSQKGLKDFSSRPTFVLGWVYWHAPNECI